jgi:hypothetical protein
MHIYFSHPTKHQMKKLFPRYFFGINSDPVITNVVDACTTCNALKTIPGEIFTQSASPSPTHPGTNFSADVIRRFKQKILATSDWYSGYVMASIIPDESHTTLRSALLTSTSLFRVKPCKIWVDNASGFKALKEDNILLASGISLDFGRAKNVNKHSIADKCCQELQIELLKQKPEGGSITPHELQETVLILNQRIRGRGLSAREILLQRDQNTGEHLNVDANTFADLQQTAREHNHLPSAKSKAKTSTFAAKCQADIGDLVYLKAEGDKLKGREQYIITGKENDNAVLQKIHGRLFSAKKYVVPFEHLLLIGDKRIPSNGTTVPSSAEKSDSSDSDSEFVSSGATIERADEVIDIPLPVDGEVVPVLDHRSDDEMSGNEEAVNEIPAAVGRPCRTRAAPKWHEDYVVE